MKRRWLSLLLLMLAAAVAVTYRGVLDNQLVRYDDELYVENPHLQSLGRDDLAWMLTNVSLFYWHPLAYFAHAVENTLWGPDPRMRHLGSVALHALNTLWVFALALAVLGGPRAGPQAPRDEADAAREEGTRAAIASFLAALLFGLHPLRVESVAWAAEKKDLLCAFFTLATFRAYLGYGWAKSERARNLRYAATVVLFVLALMSKPMALTLPFVLLLLDVYPLRRLRTARDLPALAAEKAPLVAVVLAALLLNLGVPRESARLGLHATFVLGERLMRMLWGLSAGLVRQVWPANLLPYYPLPPPEALTLSNPRTLGSAAILAAGSALCLWRWRRRRDLSWPVAWLYYLATTFPVCAFLSLGSIETGDRFSYLPSVSLYILLAAGLASALRWASRRSSSRLAAAAVCAGPVAAAVLLGALSARQIGVWRDTETLWTRVVRAFPRTVIAHTNLGGFYHQRALAAHDAALLGKAEAEYRTALAIFPDDADALNNLGIIHAETGWFAEAERDYLAALAVAPRLSMAHANLARLYVRTGEREKAARHYRLAVETGGYVPAVILDQLRRALAPE